MTTWTPAESRLLRYLAADIAPALTDPADTASRWREATHSGGGWGLKFEFGRTALTSTWHEWHEKRWQPDGTPWYWVAGELLESARIPYTRILRWVEELPAETREHARFLDRAPGFRGDCRTRYFHALIGDPDPEHPGRIGPPRKLPAAPDQRKPVRDLALPPIPPAEPNDLLELLEMTA